MPALSLVLSAHRATGNPEFYYENIDFNSSERGQTLVGIALLLVVIAIVAIGIVSLLSGNTSVLDLYNNVGNWFVSLG